MSNLSKKNINAVLHDIKHPKKGPRAIKEISRGRPIDKSKPQVKLTLVWVAICAVIVLSGYGLYVSGVTSTIAESMRGWGNDRWDSASGDPLLSSDAVLKLPKFFGDIKNVVTAIREISGSVRDLNSRGLVLVMSGTGGDEFLDILKRIHRNLAILNNIGFDVGGQIPTFISKQNSDVGNFLSDAKELERGLGAIIGFLDVPEDRRVILFFQNHSEIRPTGGFIGSYGEVVLGKGSVKSIKVDDIYTPDRDSLYKIVPPKQLQSITAGWGARDANWFFDFPTSAEKVLELLEASEMYVNDGVKFDGAVALNANVVSDILRIIGPIYVPEYDVTLTSENFLFAVRDEVEAARSANPKENPKQILALIAPTIIERVQALNDDAKADLVVSLMNRAFNKDLQVYFRDSELQEFVAGTPFSGSVYEFPGVFNGDYLAVVDSNIAGGKTDIFVEQSITLDSEITSDSKVKDSLIIERQHAGDNEEEELYRKVNQNFIKIFTPPDTVLGSAVGITPKTVVPRVDYGSDYSVDPVLSAIEVTLTAFDELDLESYVESGKKVFAGWFSTSPGETRKLELTYERGGLFVGNGAKYQFVFDKQSGVKSSLNYKVTAPDGYLWRENGSNVFSYSGNSIPARLVLNLTLVNQE
ncbi:MAG: hypothetical protein UX16_C0003G0016 [Parcubacteria group bacterium GW2011_GWB1_45_7]|nr:MAG: hypothetical protein UX16_C0003G0016 [Parcubacteria group bacterium GW2011_GWB1_45_7]